MSNEYRHTQVGWVLVVAALAAVAIPVAFVVQTGAIGQAALIGLPILFILGNLSTLTVWVEDDEIGVKFGIGIYQRRIDARTVHFARLAERPMMRGLGIRMISGGWRYAVGGSDVVELDLGGGRRVQIGSDEPEELRTAIASRIPGHPIDRGEADETSGLWRVLALFVIVIIAGLIPVMSGMRPTEMAVTDGTFHVSGALYSEAIPLADIVKVTLLDTLPTIDARTNGFAAGGKLRGHFSLKAFGRASVFVDRGKPPFIMIQTRDRIVIVGTQDAATTRDLAGRLKRG